MSDNGLEVVLTNGLRDAVGTAEGEPLIGTARIALCDCVNVETTDGDRISVLDDV